ncbi:cell division protein FtsZ [Aequorivita vladivostokensis]|uniref:Cell division protein FtsZ n=1 Tax=Aequorivita vladivostokensis TaxID=171194 RepID=A0ABR5DML1_9FLAO|nr:cell division protein FtsZ [Aequorivita vladivostokensis]KJJ40004.1 cell division protein FtsZ [Aequorivita vladivostokensis]MAB57510.1 cell division protein FtsZ [Aequorivita sp.]MBF31020.1 cell division protein FtsZ [Aequorivita sp.]|tara:strand:- start:57061 stop:59034 length:1974 start_codon:yes stop_codon:yes gene_type:complete
MSSKTEFDNISFDLPKNQSNVIKVIGVGGGGSNAINHMFSQGIKGVDFVICNTDAQALENSPVPIKIQLGVSLTEGLGAGANPKVGEQSAVESMEEIRNMLTTNTKMIFITAGMGGGTGTGAAPIIAKMAKDMDILTVGIVTIPFQFEGKTRNDQAQIGVEKLRQNVDSLVVINNNKLREVYGNLGFKAGFSKADEVLATAARGIAEVITHHYTQNIDLRDAKTVLANSGTAIMGSATASGANRAKEAIGKALDSPLLNDNKIKGAKNVLLLIVSGTDEITIDEIGEISDHIQNEAGHSANIIMGVGEEESLEGSIAITVIATGFNVEQQNEIVNTETKKIIHTLEDEQKAEHDLTPKATASAVKLPEKPLDQQPKAQAPVVKHTLFDDAEIEEKLPFDGYIKTSELLKNLNVSYEEVKVGNIEEFNQVEVNKMNVNEFVIVEAPKKEAEKDSNIANPTSEENDDQILMFDLPINSAPKKPEKNDKDETVFFDLGEIEVQDHIEVIPITEVSGEGIKRYSLDDYQEVENRLNSAKPSKLVAEEIEDEEIVFEKRTVAEPNAKEVETQIEEDPMNLPISKILSERTEERKRKMKEFNYKFKNSPSRIDEIEKQPAYKRMGIDLNETKNEPNISRTSVNTEDDEIELRKNNSFLHDNVD